MFIVGWNFFFFFFFFFHFSDTPARESYFLSSGNVFLNEFFVPYGGDGFLCFVENIFSYLIFFLQVEAAYEINGSFLGKTLFPLVEKDFLSGGNCFLLFCASFLQVETVSETS